MSADHGDITPYFEAAHPLLEAAGAEVIVAGQSGQAIDHLEGKWVTGASLTIFKFPSMDALQKFWHSTEYQSVKHLRTEVIPPNFTFAVEGFGGFD
ncbi:MAG: DUF1330 domain-containing protein [Pseudomonadales bacterium]|nr:DUF1330 domain-containing protein [Pseudomonadales bacterium]